LNFLYENILYIVVGILILIPVILKIVELPELSAIVVSFIGLATVLNGAVNISHKYITTKNKFQ
jgi:hypothetical protein